MANYTWIVQLIGVFFTVIVTMVGTTWRVSRLLSVHERNLTKIMADHQLSDTTEFARVRSELVENGDTIRHEFGETGKSLRQGIHKLELSLANNRTENLETFARRNSVFEVTKTMSENLKDLVDKVDKLGVDVAKLTVEKSKRG